MSPLNITQPWMVYGLLDGYYKVMSNIPKMGHLPTPDRPQFHPDIEAASWKKSPSLQALDISWTSDN